MEQGYLTPLRVENYDAKNWLILEDFCWRGAKGDVFTVYAGETTDFATVPWWTQSLLPRTGTWTKAAVLHDKMCNQQNEYYDLKRAYEELLKEWESGIQTVKPVEPRKPVFTSVDTDAVFRKNARDEGTDWIRAELLWFGVRCGALSRPRRKGWLSTFPRWFFDLVLILAVLIAFIAVVSWAWPW